MFQLRNADISFDNDSQTQSKRESKHVDEGNDDEDNAEAEEIDDQGGLISPLMCGPLTKDFYGE